MKNRLNIDPVGCVVSAVIENDTIFIIRLQADNPGHGWGSLAIQEIQKLGKRIELFSVADFPCMQDNLDRFYFKHGFKKQERRLMVWEPKKL